MVSTNYRDFGKQLVASGQVSMRRINDAVRRILRVKFRAGLFEHPYVNVGAAEGKQLLPKNRAAARKAAARSTVLLKNDGPVLPLNPAKSTAIIGPLGDSAHDMLGPWWGKGDDADAVSLFAGMKAQNANTTFTPGCTLSNNELYDPANECASDAGFAAAVNAAKAADQVVLALGETREMSGEAEARSMLDLPGKQEELLAAVKGDRQAARRRALQRPPAAARRGAAEHPGHPRGVVRRRRGRQRRSRRALRQGQPGRQAAGQLPAQRGPGADLLQPRADRPALRSGAALQLAPPRHRRAARRSTSSATDSATRRSRSRAPS